MEFRKEAEKENDKWELKNRNLIKERNKNDQNLSNKNFKKDRVIENILHEYDNLEHQQSNIKKLENEIFDIKNEINKSETETLKKIKKIPKHYVVYVEIAYPRDIQVKDAKEMLNNYALKVILDNYLNITFEQIIEAKSSIYGEKLSNEQSIKNELKKSLHYKTTSGGSNEKFIDTFDHNETKLPLLYGIYYYEVLLELENKYKNDKNVEKIMDMNDSKIKDSSGKEYTLGKNKLLKNEYESNDYPSSISEDVKRFIEKAKKENKKGKEKSEEYQKSLKQKNNKRDMEIKKKVAEIDRIYKNEIFYTTKKILNYIDKLKNENEGICYQVSKASKLSDKAWENYIKHQKDYKHYLVFFEKQIIKDKDSVDSILYNLAKKIQKESKKYLSDIFIENSIFKKEIDKNRKFSSKTTNTTTKQNFSNGNYISDIEPLIRTQKDIANESEYGLSLEIELKNHNIEKKPNKFISVIECLDNNFSKKFKMPYSEFIKNLEKFNEYSLKPNIKQYKNDGYDNYLNQCKNEKGVGRGKTEDEAKLNAIKDLLKGSTVIVGRDISNIYNSSELNASISTKSTQKNNLTYTIVDKKTLKDSVEITIKKDCGFDTYLNSKYKDSK